MLTEAEKNCYWTKYTDSALSFQNQGLPLDAKSASFSWNYEANHGKKPRDVFCKQDGKYNVKLTETEAKCYWTNYPKAGDEIQNQGLKLSAFTASFSFNFKANKGELRNVVCNLMKKQQNLLVVLL